jgi:hypothetical protein
MLGRVMKYEFKATARMFVLLYGAFFAVSLIYAFLMPLGLRAGQTNLPDLVYSFYQVIFATVNLLYTLMLFALPPVTMVITVVRFYRMLGDEGYLWFSLPVPTNAHILGKFIPAFAWSMGSSVLMLLSLLMVGVGYNGLQVFRVMAEVWTQVWALAPHSSLWVACAVLLVLLATASSTLSFYAAMAIGPKLTRSRLGGSILAYVIIMIILQVLSTVMMVAMTPLMAGWIEIIGYATVPSQDAMVQFLDTMSLTFAGFYTAYYVVVTAVCYLLTLNQIGKQLNLS